MHSNLINRRFVLYFSLLLSVIILSGADSMSQTYRSKITSPLTITNPSDQEAECLVANVGTSNVNVNVILVSNGSELENDNITIEPNKTAAIQTAGGNVVGGNFFRVFNIIGRNSDIRAVAKVVDFSGGFLFPQRAEATED